jgi:hypothetical protein
MDVPMDFGEALYALKHGHAVCRESWRDQGIGFVDMVRPLIGGQVMPYFRRVFPTGGEQVGWEPSFDDLMAEDWRFASLPEGVAA